MRPVFETDYSTSGLSNLQEPYVKITRTRNYTQKSVSNAHQDGFRKVYMSSSDSVLVVDDRELGIREYINTV